MLAKSFQHEEACADARCSGCAILWRYLYRSSRLVPDAFRSGAPPNLVLVASKFAVSQCRLDASGHKSRRGILQPDHGWGKIPRLAGSVAVVDLYWDGDEATLPHAAASSAL